MAPLGVALLAAKSSELRVSFAEGAGAMRAPSCGALIALITRPMSTQQISGSDHAKVHAPRQPLKIFNA